MLKIRQKKYVSNYFETYYNKDNTLENVDIEHYFDVNEQTEIINYKLIINGDDYYSFPINFAELKQSAFWADQNLFGLHIDNTFQLKTYSKLVLDCVYADSMASQLGTASPKLGYQFSPFFIFVPSKNSSINDLIWIIPTSYGRSNDPEETHPAINVQIGGTSGSGVIISEQPEFINNNLISTINVSGPSSIQENSTFTLNLLVSDTSITEIYVDVVNGITNKNRIYLTNGSGNLDVSTTGLMSGEQVKLKFGYKYFTGVTTYTKVIS